MTDPLESLSSKKATDIVIGADTARFASVSAVATVADADADLVADSSDAAAVAAAAVTANRCAAAARCDASES